MAPRTPHSNVGKRAETRGIHALSTLEWGARGEANTETKASTYDGGLRTGTLNYILPGEDGLRPERDETKKKR